MSERLAGYISGMTVELARVTEKSGRIHVLKHQKYNNADFSDFDSILSLYLRKSRIKFDIACLGVAGPVIEGEVTPTNLPWHMADTRIAESFGFQRVKLINDVVATAHSLSQLGSEKFFTINNGLKTSSGNVGLISAGYGLGEALIYSDGKKLYPYASEGGHADFAPGNQLEAELREYIYSERGGVEAEDVVSLRGLQRIYNFLIDTGEGTVAAWFARSKDRPAAIIEKALSGKDSTAARAMDIFIDCCASEAANLALKGMTRGGIYIGGPIAPQILTAFDTGRFMDRFVKKGKMETMLAGMPVGVIIDETAPLLGAASVVLSM
ncbi:MAG: glucokinase [Candidatus Zixiibacteriota bacterium]|nr:MAG: glucokinase [candidate division Zixibacteria bacterium]